MSKFAYQVLLGEPSLGEEFQLPSEERRALSLVQPDHPAALTTARLDRVSISRIRDALAQLAHGEINNVRAWIRLVAAGDANREPNPAKATELFFELMKFSVPQVKAAIVQNIGNPDTPLRELSMDELNKIVNEAN